MKRAFAIACALGAASVARGAAAADDFVRVAGTQFVIDGKPFYFVGANLNVMHSEDARRRAPETIAAAAADGLRVGRIWALGEGLPDAPRWRVQHELFRAGPDGWQEQAFLQLDRVIAEAGKRKLRLIIALSNWWSDYGGIPMYLRWAGDVHSEVYGYHDRFFTNPQLRKWFVAHLRRVVGRTNTITGVRYRDDPTIMAWELQNEMNGTPEAHGARRAWVAEMARIVRQLAPNQLVVPGVIGYYLRVERRQWIEICRLPEVSFCDQHAYPEEHIRTRGARNLRLFIDDRVQLAHHVVGKPVIFGEYGFDAGGSMRRRAAQHERFLRRVFHDGGNGALVWIYQPELSWQRKYGVLVDRREYRPLRRAFARVARQIARREPRNRNPALGPRVGERPIAPTHATVTRRRAPFARWRRVGGSRALKLEIPVERFFRAHFEELGSWAGGVLVHAYGRRTGWIEYRFRGPAAVPRRLVIRARLSSEFPGRLAPEGGSSRVTLLLDGTRIASIEAAPDDGVGAWREVVVTEPELLRRLPGRTHALRFAVEDGPMANGLALYGVETRLNREPVADPGPLQLIVEPAARGSRGASRR